MCITCAASSIVVEMRHMKTSIDLKQSPASVRAQALLAAVSLVGFILYVAVRSSVGS